MEVQQPPASAVRKFLSLLEQRDMDFTEELECQRLKSQVVSAIRSNQHLEQDLNVMDIKIGLLVKNRISLQVKRRYDLLWEGGVLYLMIYRVGLVLWLSECTQLWLCVGMFTGCGYVQWVWLGVGVS